MMSPPDFKEKQLLFISAQEAAENKLQFKNDNICLARDGKIIDQLSCHKILAVFIIGDFSITTILIRNCQKYGVSLFLLKNNLEMYADILSTAKGNFLLRIKQYSISDDLLIAKHLVANKIFNQIQLLHSENQNINKDKLLSITRIEIEKFANVQELLGLEGSFSKNFFNQYFKEIGWRKREPRIKSDTPNLLMDLGYTILFNFVDAIINLFGFDGYKGFYHKLFFQRKSLVCDLIEPFRCIIDKQILKSYHLGQIVQKDFKNNKGKLSLNFEEQKKYLQLFATAVMGEKEGIFNYIRSFYYCILNDTKNYPFFKIK